jgi:hypothetical protein
MLLTGPEKFRSFRDRCLVWARTARAEDERMFLDMAKGWEAAARQLEQSAERIADSRDMLRRIGTRSDRAVDPTLPPITEA